MSRAAEARLNQFAHFRADLEGLGIHFIHARSPEPDATPLVMTHGWPGSVVEFLKVLGPLSDPRSHGGDPADAFHVVCPSLPGYGFSDKPTETGWGLERIGRAWATLMADLGYSSYFAQGGDWGSAVTSWESLEHFMTAGGPVGVPTGVTLFPKEIVRISRRWAENRFSDVRYWNEVDRGGHFASFEQPEIFVEELRTFFRLFR